MSMLLPIISSLFILRQVYKERSRMITVLFVIIIFGSMSILTIYKNLNESDLSKATEQVGTGTYSNLLNMYFAGLPNIIAGIDLKTNNVSNFSFDTLLNDIFGYTMGLSKDFSGINSTKIYGDYLSNYQLSKDFYDQILPTIIHGYFYFGFIFSPVFTVIMIFSFMFFDHIVLITKRLDFAFIFAWISAIVGFAIPGGLYHLTINLTNVLLPLLLISLINGVKAPQWKQFSQ